MTGLGVRRQSCLNNVLQSGQLHKIDVACACAYLQHVQWLTTIEMFGEETEANQGAREVVNALVSCKLFQLFPLSCF